jgi:apolipoprotein N-acyltransferase
MTSRGVAAALLSGALLAVSRDTGQFGWLVLVAPVPLLIDALRAPRAWHVTLLAFAAGLMGEAGPMWFYGRVLPMIYGLAAYQALMFTLGVLFMRALHRRFAAGVAVLGFAAMAAATEYLYGLVAPNGSFGALGYALVDVVPLLQTASLAGVAGLTFLAAAIPAGLAVLRVKPRDAMAALAWSIPVLAALLYGSWQLAQASGPALRIALLSDDRYAGRVFDHPAAGPEVAAAFARQVASAATQRPAAIVLPEKMLAAGTRLAPPPGSVIVAGLDGPAPRGGRLNIAALYEPDAPVRTYLKKRMVPGLEAEYTPGTSELVTQIDGRKVGLAICKDMDFAQDLRLYGRRDVGLMLVPAWDFDRDAHLHGRMAVVRSVENGFSLARSASQGLMTLSDANGRIVAERRTVSGPSMLVGEVPIGRGGTVYSRIGDVFAQAMVAVWLALLAMLVLARKPGIKRPDGPGPSPAVRHAPIPPATLRRI